MTVIYRLRQSAFNFDRSRKWAYACYVPNIMINTKCTNSRELHCSRPGASASELGVGDRAPWSWIYLV